MQLKAVLADQHGDDSLIAADYRQRKKMTLTLVMEYERLLSMKIHLETTKRTATVHSVSLTDECLWFKRWVPGEARHLIVTVELLIRSREGHFPRLNVLLRDQCFQKLVLRVNVDEAHHIHTAGVPLYGLDAFRPACGKLGQGGMVLNDKVYSGVLCSKAVFERWALSACAINKCWNSWKPSLYIQPSELGDIFWQLLTWLHYPPFSNSAVPVPLSRAFQASPHRGIGHRSRLQLQ